MKSTIGISASRSNLFVTSLSIHIAEPNTHEPTNGTFAILNNPCIEPSSPYVPCNTGNTISTISFLEGLVILYSSPLDCGKNTTLSVLV